jgi:hypothetical protein
MYSEDQLRTIGNIPRRTPVRDFLMAFKLQYICDYETKLFRKQAEVVQNHENANIQTLDKANPDTGNIRSLNLEAVKHMIIQVTRLPL